MESLTERGFNARIRPLDLRKFAVCGIDSDPSVVRRTGAHVRRGDPERHVLGIPLHGSARIR
jgi:hypothetical protein